MAAKWPSLLLVVLAALGVTCGSSGGGSDLRPALTPTRAPLHAMSRTARVMPSCWLHGEGSQAIAGVDGAGLLPQHRLGAGPNIQLRGGGVAESDGSDDDGEQGGSAGEGEISDDGNGSGGSGEMESGSASDAPMSGAGDAGSGDVTGEGGGKRGAGLFVPPPPMHPDAGEDAAQFAPGIAREMQVCRRNLGGASFHESRWTMVFHEEPVWCPGWCPSVSPWPAAARVADDPPPPPPLADRPGKPRRPRSLRHLAARSPPPLSLSILLYATT